MKPFSFLLIAVLLVAISCQQNDGSNQAEYLSREPNDSSSVTGLTGNAVKLVKTAGMQLKVQEVEKSTKAISEVARKYAGAIHYHNFRSPQTGRKELKVSEDSLLVITTVLPQADLTVRIPSENLEPFLFEIVALGYHTENIVLKIDDKSLFYLENELRRKNRVAATTNQSKADSNSNLRTLQVKDEAVAHYIANKAIDAEAAYSTINLTLSQNAIVQKEMIANYVIADYDLPLSTRLGHAFSKGGKVFLNLLAVFLHLWPFVLIGIGIYTIYRIWQRRKITL